MGAGGVDELAMSPIQKSDAVTGERVVAATVELPGAPFAIEVDLEMPGCPMRTTSYTPVTFSDSPPAPA